MTMVYPDTEGAGRRYSEHSMTVRRWREGADGFSAGDWTQKVDEEQLAKYLGWFSIGLGLTEVLAPRALARCIGIKARPALLGFIGVREIASGIGIVTERRPAAWVWSRVGGDMMDLALLTLALATNSRRRGRIAAATAAVAGVTALDLLCSEQLSDGVGQGGAIHTG